MTEFEVESMSEESELESDDSDLEVNFLSYSCDSSNFLIASKILYPIFRNEKNNFIFLSIQLQEAFARGDLKPGLNIEVGGGVKRKAVNNIVSCNTPSNVHFISMRISISFMISFSRISAGFTTKIGRIQIEIAMD